MQQNNGMSRAAAMAYRVLIRRGVSALPVHPLEILSACRNTVVWADVTAAEQLKIPREALLRQLANAEAITFRQTIQGETVCLLSKLNVKHHIEVEITMDELDLTAAESKATYDEIKAYVLEKFGFKVSQLYIAQIKRKCGIIERKNYNQSKKEDAKVPKCPPEKEAAIMDALKHFQMIP